MFRITTTEIKHDVKTSLNQNIVKYLRTSLAYVSSMLTGINIFMLNNTAIYWNNIVSNCIESTKCIKLLLNKLNVETSSQLLKPNYYQSPDFRQTPPKAQL